MALAYLAATRDLALDIVYESTDPDYQQCIEDVIGDTVTSRLSQELKNVKGDIIIREGLILLDARRILLPTPAIKPILAQLHVGHAGQEKTLTLANQLFFWHGMSNNIKTMIDNCDQCQERRPAANNTTHGPRHLRPLHSAHPWPMSALTSSTLLAKSISFMLTGGQDSPCTKD